MATLNIRSTLSCLITFLCFPGSVNFLLHPIIFFLNMQFKEGRQHKPIVVWVSYTIVLLGSKSSKFCVSRINKLL